MNAKLYRDGDRIIVSFESVNDAEGFLQNVVKILSDASEEPAPITEVPALDAPIDSEEDFVALQEEDLCVSSEEMHEEEPEIKDFSEPFTGKTPTEIASVPRFEGIYFLFDALRNNNVPSRFKKDSVELVVSFIDSKGVLNPPYNDLERMEKYIKMSQAMLGKKELPDAVINVAKTVEQYNSLCEAAAKTIEKIRCSLNS